MKINLRNLVLSAAALCTSTAFAASQAKLNVPFDFTVKNHAYHAGSYRVEIDRSTSVVKMMGIQDTSAPLTWLVRPGNSASDPSKVLLTFDTVGSGHVLRSVQYGSAVTPDLDKRSKHDAEETTITGE